MPLRVAATGIAEGSFVHMTPIFVCIRHMQIAMAFDMSCVNIGIFSRQIGIVFPLNVTSSSATFILKQFSNPFKQGHYSRKTNL